MCDKTTAQLCSGNYLIYTNHLSHSKYQPCFFLSRTRHSSRPRCPQTQASTDSHPENRSPRRHRLRVAAQTRRRTPAVGERVVDARCARPVALPGLRGPPRAQAADDLGRIRCHGVRPGVAHAVRHHRAAEPRVRAPGGAPLARRLVRRGVERTAGTRRRAGSSPARTRTAAVCSGPAGTSARTAGTAAPGPRGSRTRPAARARTRRLCG